MDIDQVWTTIDAQRAQAADLLDSLSEQQWQTPSLCAGWRVRGVAAHLTLAHTGPGPAAVAILRARGSFNRMIRDTAVRASHQPVAYYSAWLRSVAGSRRTAVGVTPIEPMLDILVHQQDIARPLGIRVDMPVEPARVAAERAWSMSFPFGVRRRLRGLRLQAVDTDWSIGDGVVLEAPMAELLMLITGRSPATGSVHGPGANRLAELTARR